MMIVMTPHATREQIEEVVRRIEGEGFTAHRSDGKEQTVIGAVGHDVSRLFDPAGGPSGSIAFDFMRGASALLGPRIPATRAFTAAPFPYLGYDTTQSPLLDVLYGWSQLLRDPGIGDTLDLGETLLADHSAGRKGRQPDIAVVVGDMHAGTAFGDEIQRGTGIAATEDDMPFRPSDDLEVMPQPLDLVGAEFPKQRKIIECQRR